MNNKISPSSYTMGQDEWRISESKWMEEDSISIVSGEYNAIYGYEVPVTKVVTKRVWKTSVSDVFVF